MSILLEPEVEVVAPALLIPLADILIFGTCLALTLTTKYWLRAIFAPANFVVGHIPLLADLVGQPIKAIEKRVIHWCSEAAIGSEKRVGKAWHTLAQTVTGVAELLFALAVVDALIVDHIVRVWGLPTLAHKLAGTRTIVKYVKTTVEHPTRGKIGAGIKTSIAGLALGLFTLKQFTHKHIRALEAQGAHAIPWGIPGLRARERATERSLARAWRKIRELDRRKAGTLAAAAVGVALAKLGASWITCKNWKRIGRAGCNMDSDTLTSLLLDASVVAIAFNIETFARELQEVTEEAANLIIDWAE